MDERDQRMVGVQVGGELGDRPEGEPVDDNRDSFRNGAQPAARRIEGAGARPRKVVADIGDLDAPAEPRELGDHAPVIRIAAGRRREITRYRENEAVHRNDPSYQARARWDRERAPQVAATPSPRPPTPPRRAAAASRSNTYLVRNSVVVLWPRN